MENLLGDRETVIMMINKSYNAAGESNNCTRSGIRVEERS